MVWPLEGSSASNLSHGIKSAWIVILWRTPTWLQPGAYVPGNHRAQRALQHRHLAVLRFTSFTIPSSSADFAQFHSLSVLKRKMMTGTWRQRLRSWFRYVSWTSAGFAGHYLKMMPPLRAVKMVVTSFQWLHFDNLLKLLITLIDVVGYLDNWVARSWLPLLEVDLNTNWIYL